MYGNYKIVSIVVKPTTRKRGKIKHRKYNETIEK